jgi:WNK lysine deficient protein kinase
MVHSESKGANMLQKRAEVEEKLIADALSDANGMLAGREVIAVKHERKVSLVGETELVFKEMDPSERYGRFDEELGRGACKIVYKAFDTQEGREVAWNKVDLGKVSGGIGDDSLENEEQDRILAEIRVLKALKHKNIMSFYKWWYNEKLGEVNFISEMFASGTLRRYRKKHKHLGEDVLKQWGWQILSGLVYLHGHKPPIVHRDLKCDNIFINGADGVVKIGDLGLATMLHGRTAPQSVIGTPEFMAPELYDEFYDDRVDVYAFGMVMLELSTMEYPYCECSNAAQIYRKVSLGIRPVGLQKVECRELADFINTCIAPLEQRPRSRQLLKHPYFASIRNSLHPSKSELFMAANGSHMDSGNGRPAPRSSNAAFGREPFLSNGSNQSSGPVPQISRSVSASPVPFAFEANEAQSVIPSELMRELVDTKLISSDGNQERNSHGSRSTTPPPTHRSSPGGMASPPGEKLPSPLGPNSSVAMPNGTAAPQQQYRTPATAPKRRKGVCRCAATDRCFEFAGKYREDKGKRLLNLRLKITEPDLTSRTIEFEYDLTKDTATSVASEMVAALDLTPEDAVAISEAMEAEIMSLLASLEGQASTDLALAAAELQQELSSALQHASSSDFPGSGATNNSLAPPEQQRLQYRTVSGIESMASFHSQDSLSSGLQRSDSGLSSPARSANRSPVNGPSDDLYMQVSNVQGPFVDALHKGHCPAEKTIKTPPGGSSRSSFEVRLSPRESELSRDSVDLQSRSLKKLYESLQQVSSDNESPGANSKPEKPPLQPQKSSASLHSAHSGHSGQSGSASFNGLEDEKHVCKDDKLQQAMNALKVVESRSLDMLGGGGSSKNLRGIPMSAEPRRAPLQSTKSSENLMKHENDRLAPHGAAMSNNSSRESNMDILISPPCLDNDSGPT